MKTPEFYMIFNRPNGEFSQLATEDEMLDLELGTFDAYKLENAGVNSILNKVKNEILKSGFLNKLKFIFGKI